jgi:hypothetical protein
LKRHWITLFRPNGFENVAAGAAGGIANFFIAPLLGAIRLTTACGVQITPHLCKVPPRGNMGHFKAFYFARLTIYRIKDITRYAHSNYPEA